MDASATRRGGPSSHVMFAGAHSGADWRGGSESFGRAGAILLGDLLLMWSAEMWGSSGLAPEALERARPYLDLVRTEVTVGQYLDMVAQVAVTDPSSALDRAGRVLEYKSARYTVMRPSQLGAALGGGSPELVDGLGRYGSPIGRAFQLRDDVLGVFGDESVTGKPAGDDLREGKRTLLVAHAMALATRPSADRLDSLLGDPRLDTRGHRGGPRDHRGQRRVGPRREDHRRRAVERDDGARRHRDGRPGPYRLRVPREAGRRPRGLNAADPARRGTKVAPRDT